MLQFDGQKLKELRKEKGLTQTALGVLVGKKVEHICHYEKGRATPPSDVLLNMLRLFQVAPEGLSKDAQNLAAHP